MKIKLRIVIFLGWICEVFIFYQAKMGFYEELFTQKKNKSIHVDTYGINT